MKFSKYLALLISLVLFACRLASAAPPNFVWIIADDMSPDTGAYGLNLVKTPHLDRLAADGRKYTRAYATAPVCSASHSASDFRQTWTKRLDNPDPTDAQRVAWWMRSYHLDSDEP